MMRRVEQITVSHCGPAVCVMLLSFLGVDLSQESIVEAAGVNSKIEEFGILVPEMGRAIKYLVPQFQFWYKENSTLTDLKEIIRSHKYPVGVEWQGVFYEDADEDNGHYSIVTHIDTINNLIVLTDPYKRFAGIDRTFHVLEFENRWWDENEIHDSQTGKTELVRDYHMMFLVTDKNASFPESIGMIRS